jgi:hypothetical protein
VLWLSNVQTGVGQMYELWHCATCVGGRIELEMILRRGSRAHTNVHFRCIGLGSSMNQM